jgi:hypothetical protein
MMLLGHCWNGLRLAINRGRLWLHESDAFVELTQAGANLFAQGWPNFPAAEAHCRAMDPRFQSDRRLRSTRISNRRQPSSVAVASAYHTNRSSLAKGAAW